MEEQIDVVMDKGGIERSMMGGMNVGRKERREQGREKEIDRSR